MELIRKALAEELLSELREEAGEGLACDEQALFKSLDGESLQLNQLPIKVISILGGLLAAILFTGFLFVLGMWQSGAFMAIIGLLFIGCSLLAINQEVSTFFSATAIAFLIIGFMLLGAGVVLSSESVTLVCLVLMLASGCLFFLTTNGLVLFLITLLFLGSSLVLLLETRLYGLLHLLVAMLTTLLLYWSLSEIQLIAISRQLNSAYRPIRMGLIFAFGFLMAFLAGSTTFDSSMQIPYEWISGVLLLLALFAFAWCMLQRLVLHDAQSGSKKSHGYLLLPLLMLPMIPAPGVVGSFLLILLGFHIRHLPSLGVGVVAFCYTLFLFYYDLHLTLLEKSGMLLLSGGWFLVGYILIKRHAK